MRPVWCAWRQLTISIPLQFQVLTEKRSALWPKVWQKWCMTNLPAINRRGFLRLTALATGSLAAISLPAAAPVPAVPGRRLERLATGANVCGWFRSPRNETTEHFSGYIPETEAAFMASLGLKHVRLCVAPRVIMNPATGDVLEDRAKYLEAAIERFHRAGLLVSHIGWAVWGWDEGFDLNRRIVDGKPVVDTVVVKALGLKEN